MKGFPCSGYSVLNSHSDPVSTCSGTEGLVAYLILQLTGISCDDLQPFAILRLMLIPCGSLQGTGNSSWGNIQAAHLDLNRQQAIKPRALEWLPIYSGQAPCATN
jgi:hypothetical protein